MYQNHFGLDTKPFSLTPDPHFVYKTQAYTLARDTLLQELGKGTDFAILSGEAGVGKTQLLLQLMDDLTQLAKPVLIPFAGLSFEELVSYVCDELSIGSETDTHEQRLEAFAASLDEHPSSTSAIILLIDSSENLCDNLLARLPELPGIGNSHLGLVQVVLAGPPALAERLSHPDFSLLAQRVSLSVTLAPMHEDEVAKYISHRLAIAGAANTHLFENDAVTCVAGLSAGVPRLINRVCDQALQLAAGERRSSVDADTISEAYLVERKDADEPATQDATTTQRDAAKLEEEQLSGRYAELQEEFQFDTQHDRIEAFHQRLEDELGADSKLGEHGILRDGDLIPHELSGSQEDILVPGEQVSKSLQFSAQDDANDEMRVPLRQPVLFEEVRSQSTFHGTGGQAWPSASVDSDWDIDSPEPTPFEASIARFCAGVGTIKRALLSAGARLFASVPRWKASASGNAKNYQSPSIRARIASRRNEFDSWRTERRHTRAARAQAQFTAGRQDWLHVWYARMCAGFGVVWAHVKTGWRVAAAWCMDLFARPSGKALVWGARGVAVAGVLWFLGVAVSDSLKPTTWTDVAGSSDAPARTSDSKPLSKAPPANNASIDVTQRSLPQSAKAQSERPQLASAQTAAQSGPDTTVTGRSVSVARDIDTKNTASFAESTASAHAIELLERERKSVQTLMTELERIRAENAKLKAAQLAEQATTNITQDIATVPAAVVNAAAARETRAEDIAYQQHQAHTESVSQTHIVVRNQAEEPLPVAQQLEQRDDLEALLSRADTLRAEEQLTVPPENNALTAYRDALEMSPGDPRALAGIADIKRQFLTWADEAKVQGDVAKAKRHYRKALFVDPHDEEISVLLAELVDATGDARTASVQVENQAIALRVSDSVASYSGRAVEQDSEADAVATNVNLNAVNARGETVLHLAARAGNTIETRRLLKAGADPDHANEAGDTSLFHAAWNNHLDVASALIEAGATVRNRNSDGWTPLIYASINGHTRLVKLLLSNGADVDAMNHEGQTALAAAAWNGHSKTALTLISANANLDLKDRDGWTALMKAAWNGYDEIVKVLLENGANPTLRTPAGETARKLASNSGHSTAAALLRLP